MSKPLLILFLSRGIKMYTKMRIQRTSDRHFHFTQRPFCAKRIFKRIRVYLNEHSARRPQISDYSQSAYLSAVAPFTRSATNKKLTQD